MDRNIEIRANAIYPILQEGHSENKIKNAQFHAYIKGATEQRAIDDAECMTMVDAAVKEARRVFIERAKEWLKEQLCSDDGEWYKQLDNFMFIDAFEKAMEE